MQNFFNLLFSILVPMQVGFASHGLSTQTMQKPPQHLFSFIPRQTQRQLLRIPLIMTVRAAVFATPDFIYLRTRTTILDSHALTIP